jgi:hypothetical protein
VTTTSGTDGTPPLHDPEPVPEPVPEPASDLEPAPVRPARPVPGALRVAAIASLGAGAIHATAAGAHSEHRSAVVAFVVTAVAQIAWGALALSRPWRLVALAGAAINAAAIGGWVMAKTSGIGFVTGLEEKEAAQFADTLSAALAAVAVVGALAALAGLLGLGRGSRLLGRPHPALVGVAAVATIGLVVPGMVKTGSHSHSGAAHEHAETAAAGHDDHAAGAEEGHDHADAAAEGSAASTARPYDATLPVDLSGYPGVTADQQAEAEGLVTEALQKLPQFADIPTIEAMGYRSIGDAFTGHEHFMKWDLISDGRMLDADYPESLVFEVDRATGEKRLAAAMYMANLEDTLETVPDIGGELIQWHIHDNLCFRGEEGAWRVGDVAPPGTPCEEGTFRLSDNDVPMIHVWIVPHECGPFSALEGVGAGQVAPGETKTCNHVHGSA